MIILRDTSNFRAGDFVYAKEDFTNSEGYKVRTKDKRYVVENIIAQDFLEIQFDDGEVWQSRANGYYSKRKYILTDFL
jgi:hypothetical protein